MELWTSAMGFVTRTVTLAALGLGLSLAPLPTWAQAADLTKGLPRFTQKALVTMETSKGTILLEVNGKDAPISAGNFLDLVKRKFYNGLTFHRVEPNFVVQGGDPNGNGTGSFINPETKKERTIPLEIKVVGAKEPTYGQTLTSGTPVLTHQQGALAWARSGDPNSASCQFYITLAKTDFLNGNYAVFGKVIKGMDVVSKITPGDKILKVEVAK